MVAVEDAPFRGWNLDNQPPAWRRHKNDTHHPTYRLSAEVAVYDHYLVCVDLCIDATSPDHSLNGRLSHTLSSRLQGRLFCVPTVLKPVRETTSANATDRRLFALQAQNSVDSNHNVTYPT